MNAWLGLLRKELLEISRDKRALLSGFGIAFLAPLIIYGGVGFAISQSSSTSPVWIEVINADRAPGLMETLAEARIFDVADWSGEGEEPTAKLEVIIDDDFATAIAKGWQTQITLRGDLNDDAVRPVLGRTRDILRQFASATAGVRLLMRGIDPRIVQPIQLREQNTAPASNTAGRLTMMIGIYVMMAAFISAISTAVDTSAGERERNVLEMLLIQPVRPFEIVSAKLAGIFLVAMLGVLLTLTFSALAMGQVELERVGMTFSLEPINFVLILMVMLPLALLAGSINLWVGYLSKTFKEAQSQVAMVMLIPALGPMTLMFVPEPPDLLRQMPVTGQFMFLEQILKAEAVAALEPILASLLTLVLVVVFTWLASRHLASERSINAL